MATKYELAIIIDGNVHTFGELVGNNFVAKDGTNATTLKVANSKPVIVEGVQYELSWRSFVNFKAANPKKSAAVSKQVPAAEAVKSLLAKKNPTMLAKNEAHSYFEGINAEILRMAEAAKGNLDKVESKQGNRA